jgi:hypothetical protein
LTCSIFTQNRLVTSVFGVPADEGTATRATAPSVPATSVGRTEI